MEGLSPLALSLDSGPVLQAAPIWCRAAPLPCRRVGSSGARGCAANWRSDPCGMASNLPPARPRLGHGLDGGEGNGKMVRCVQESVSPMRGVG